MKMAQIDLELIDVCKGVNFTANNSFRKVIWNKLKFVGRKEGDAERFDSMVKR